MSDHHWYDNDSTLGLGLGMIMLSRRYARQQAAEAPYKEAEFAAWWAGLTPVQQAAYNASLEKSLKPAASAIRQPPRLSPRALGLATAAVFVVLSVLAVVGDATDGMNDGVAWGYFIGVIMFGLVVGLIAWLARAFSEGRSGLS